MNTHNNHLITAILALLLMLPALHSTAQDAPSTNDQWKQNRWSGHFSAGISSFKTKGIPLSRNEINYLNAHPEYEVSTTQGSEFAGVGYEAAVYYQIMRKGKIGLIINAFKDNSEYQYSDNKKINSEAIIADSMNKITISNMQSYLNIGLSYEHRVYESPSGRHRFNAAIATGLSINRTPDRSEFDYFDPNHYIAIDTSGTDIWRLTHTRFKNGFFLSPSLNYELCFRNNHCLQISIAKFFQWHSTERSLKILDKPSLGSRGDVKYSVNAIQIKIGYSF
jgi:hypothetical protein